MHGGLDSVGAARVASVLRALADGEHHPVCVVASIHQPSSRVYHEFNRVLLLGGEKHYMRDLVDLHLRHSSVQKDPMHQGKDTTLPSICWT